MNVVLVVNPDEPDTVIGVDAFDAQIGKSVPLVGMPGGPTSGTLVKADVAPDGTKAILEFELDAQAARDFERVYGLDYHFTSVGFSVHATPIPAEPQTPQPGKHSLSTADDIVADLELIRAGARLTERERLDGTVLAAVGKLLLVIADGPLLNTSHARAAAVDVSQALHMAMVEPLAEPGRYNARLREQIQAGIVTTDGLAADIRNGADKV